MRPSLVVQVRAPIMAVKPRNVGFSVETATGWEFLKRMEKAALRHKKPKPEVIPNAD